MRFIDSTRFMKTSLDALPNILSEVFYRLLFSILKLQRWSWCFDFNLCIDEALECCDKCKNTKGYLVDDANAGNIYQDCYVVDEMSQVWHRITIKSYKLISTSPITFGQKFILLV